MEEEKKQNKRNRERIFFYSTRTRNIQRVWNIIRWEANLDSFLVAFKVKHFNFVSWK